MLRSAGCAIVATNFFHVICDALPESCGSGFFMLSTPILNMEGGCGHLNL